MTLRCIRHFAIYEQRWPSRVPLHGTSSATPRAENAPVEQRHVVRIGAKVSSAAHKSKNLTRDDQEEEEASPKRRRTIVNQKVSSTGHRDSKLGRDQEKASKASAKFVAAYRAITLSRDEGEEQEGEEKRPSRSQKALPVHLDPKMSAVYKAKNLVPDEQEEEDGRPSKRPRNRKVSSAGYRGGGLRREKGKASAKRIATACRAIALLRDEQNEEEEHLPRNQKVLPVRIGSKVSFAAYRAICGRDKQDRFSRRHIPRKMQIAEQIARRVAALDRNTSEPTRRKRGRPRLSSPRVMSKSKVKTEELQVDIPVVAQPRATNGRFGKKDKTWRKSREYTAAGSTVADDDDDLESRTTRRKRGIDAVEDFEEPPKKRSASEQNPDSGNEVEGPGQKVLPRPASGFRGGRLFSNPNPLRFALYAWAGPLILDESSDDDEKHPETPEDGLSSAADIAPAEELMDPMFLPSILPRAPPLTCKPSPFVFAKNRWNATSAVLNKVVDNNRRASTNSTLSENNLRPNPRTSNVSSEVILSSLQKYLQLILLCFLRSPDFPLLIVRAYVPSLKIILLQCGPMTKPTCPNCDTCILCSLLLLRL